jgi:hypothetical protein
MKYELTPQQAKIAIDLLNRAVVMVTDADIVKEIMLALSQPIIEPTPKIMPEKQSKGEKDEPKTPNA